MKQSNAQPTPDRVIGTLPLPPAGALEIVPAQSDTVFNWDYDMRREALVNLYEKGKRLQWNATTDIDWSIDVDPEQFPEFFPPEMFNTMLNPPRQLTMKELKNMRVHQLGWMLSQFMHGEQGALLATAQIVNTVPWTDAKFYAASARPSTMICMPRYVMSQRGSRMICPSSVWRCGFTGYAYGSFSVR